MFPVLFPHFPCSFFEYFSFLKVVILNLVLNMCKYTGNIRFFCKKFKKFHFFAINTANL